METPSNAYQKRQRNKKDLSDKHILKGMAGLRVMYPVSVFERLKRVVGFDRCKDVSELIKETRIIKSSFELAQVRKSGEMLSRVFEKAHNVVQEGKTRLEIEAALVAEGRRIGHQGFSGCEGLTRGNDGVNGQTGYTGTISTMVDGAITGTGVTPAMPQGSSLKRVERGVGHY